MLLAFINKCVVHLILIMFQMIIMILQKKY